MYGEVGVEFHAFLTFALHGGELSASRLGRFISWHPLNKMLRESHYRAVLGLTGRILLSVYSVCKLAEIWSIFRTAMPFTFESLNLWMQ
jgi:hypothetical protein